MFWIDTVEPGGASVDYKSVAPGIGDIANKLREPVVACLSIDAGAVFDGHGDADCVAHGDNTVGNKLRLFHQAGAKLTLLHFVTGTAAVEIYFAIAVAFGNFGTFRERPRIAAAQLQREWLLKGFESEVMVPIPAEYCAHCYHFGIEQRSPGE